VPQLVPAGAFAPVSTQLGGPASQAMLPTWQALPGGVHAWLPEEHGATHCPLSHTLPEPQSVPSFTKPVAEQVPEQVSAPVAHGLFAGVQGPDWQAS
jgi:hypothetical protein